MKLYNINNTKKYKFNGRQETAGGYHWEYV